MCGNQNWDSSNLFINQNGKPGEVFHRTTKKLANAGNKPKKVL